MYGVDVKISDACSPPFFTARSGMGISFLNIRVSFVTPVLFSFLSATKALSGNILLLNGQIPTKVNNILRFISGKYKIRFLVKVKITC